MSYSYTVNTGDGVTVTFPFSFAGQDTGYLRPTDIKVYVNLVDTPFNIIVSDPNKVVLTTAPAIGAEVLIRRIMPKDVPYTDFARGNPFSQDSLNNTNLQMLYNIQEIYDGYLPAGFFFRQDIDMHGFKLTNLGEGTDSGDSINYDQHLIEVLRNDDQEVRILTLEDALASSTYINYVSQLYVATGGEVTINTYNNLHAASLYINGIFQHKAAGAYSQIGGLVTLAEPITAGTEVYLILGSDLPSEALYASIESFAELHVITDDIEAAAVALASRVTINEANIAAINSRLVTVEDSYATRGINANITALTGLTTALSVAQGGTGGTTSATARFGLSAAVLGDNNDITKLSNLSGGITGLVTGVAATTGLVGEEASSVSGTATTLATGALANVITISLAAGEWELDSAMRVTNSGNLTALTFGVSTTTVTLPTNWYDQYRITTTIAAGQSTRQGMSRRVLLSATTTLYLVVQATFTGTCTADGYIRARRVR